MARGTAVVVGAGIGGLAAAMALSRVGFEVVVIERDDTPMPDDVEGAFEWDRRGAPQVRHTHGFPALIRMILREASWLIAIGTAFGVPLAMLAARGVRTMLYGIAPLDPLAYVAGTAILIVVAFIAALVPARRASRIAPSVALGAGG